MVERPFVVRWVVGSIPNDGPIDISCSVCGKTLGHLVVGFFSRFLSGTLQ